MLGRAAKYAVARWIPGLLNFAAIGIYTRLLTDEQYGRYAIVLAWVLLINAVGFEWLRAGVRRFYVAFEHDVVDFLATIRGAFLGLAAVVAAGAVGLSVWVGPDTRPLIVVGACLLLAWSWCDLNLEMTLARIHTSRYAVALLWRASSALAFGVTLALLGFGATGVLTGAALGFGTAGLWVSWREGTLRGRRGQDPDLRRRLLRYGLPLTFSSTLVFVVNTSDRLLLDLLVGTAVVGPYAAAYDLTQMGTTVLVMPVYLIGVPTAVRTFELEGATRAREELARVAALLFAVALPVMTGLILVSSNLSEVVLGPAFRAAASTIIPVVAFAAFLGALKTHYFDLAFVLGTSTRAQAAVSGSAAMLNIVANLVLIPRFGAAGAAWATVTALGFGLLLSGLVGRAIMSLPIPIGSWVRTAVATAAMALLLHSLAGWSGPVALAVQILGGCSVYAAAAVALDLCGIRGEVRAFRDTRRSVGV